MPLIIIGAILLIIFMPSIGNTPGVAQSMTPQQAIQQYITDALGLPAAATNILLTQAKIETGDFRSSVYFDTNSLFNRHMGFGVAGVPNSDGYWTGQTYNAGPGDSDLRIYSDIGQSAQDMAQLLQEGLYGNALAALHDGDLDGYFNALNAAGFADPEYAQSTWSSIYAALA